MQIAGNAMLRRAMYQFGRLLPPGERGQVDCGLGKTMATGTVTLIPPTDLVRTTGERRVTLGRVLVSDITIGGGVTPVRVPDGLRAVFSALQSDGYRDVHVASTPEAFLDVPPALARVGQQDTRAFTEALAAAANREFPGGGFGPDGTQPASECPEVLALSAFWAGVAACWYVMTAINGKGGAL